jgi:hypothetical protein
MIYNLFSCGGFSTDLLGGCSKAWLGMALLFLIIALVRKWGAEEWGIGYSFIYSSIAGLLGYFLVITFTGNVGISFLVGLIIGIGIGYGIGFVTGGSDSDSGGYE